MRISFKIIVMATLLSASNVIAEEKTPQGQFGLPADALLWSVQQDGKTTIMTCNSSKCGGKSSVVSFMYLQGQTSVSAEDFSNYIKKLANARATMGNGQTKVVSSSDLSQGADLHYKVTETITGSFGSEYMIEGYASRAGRAVTLESSSPDRATAEKNYSFLYDLTKKTN